MKKEEQYMELPFKVGDVFKNYKALCKVLGEKQRNGGTSRQAHLKRWEEYFLWRREGHKYIITEIIDKKYPTHDNSQIGKRTKEYSEYLQRIILFLLYTRYKEDGKFHAYVSRRGIALFAELVRYEFFSLVQEKGKQEGINSIAEELNEINSVINLMLGRVDRTLTNDINTALSQLKQKMLIEYRIVNMVIEDHNFSSGIPIEKMVEIRDYLNDDELFEQYFKYRGINTKDEKTEPEFWKYEAREANNIEETIIIHTRKEILKDMGYLNEKDLYIRGNVNEFYETVNKKLRDYFGIISTFKNYAIYFSPYFVKEAILTNEEELKLHEFEFEMLKNLLNEGFSNHIRENAMKYYEQAKEQYKLNNPDKFLTDKPKGYKKLSYNQELVFQAGSFEGTLDYIIERLILRE